MAGTRLNTTIWCALLLIVLASPSHAFGAGNIASISKIEGRNFRHGDIEDILKTVAFIKGHKWTNMMIKRVYFGNWLRDYSQALDVGTLKSCQADTIRILVWVLSFLSFGYATGEFEVSKERLGVYRPEEHIDNPRDYADNEDATKFDPRLRAPVQPIELGIDYETGLKNYIANERLGIATSAGYVKYSLNRSIHYGRTYTSGTGSKGKDEDLFEAMRCLGQALHCLEDFGAHSNYTELVLREMGFLDVFPHTGVATQINLRGRQVFPLVTGTFGVVDFLHSVIGEATDHFAQSEVDQMDTALGNASEQSKKDGDGESSRGGPDGPGSSRGGSLGSMTSLLSQVPGAGGLVQQAQHLQSSADQQEQLNRASVPTNTQAPHPQQPPSHAPPASSGGPSSNIPGTNIDPLKTVASIYPILEFRDKVAKAISATIEKIPGLQALVEKITETLTLFVLSLLAPFIRPIINAVSDSLKTGSSGVIESSGRHQFEPWTDPNCTDPTHSLLSKDHFSNVLNEPAGKVATMIVQYVAPRVFYAWENPGIDVNQVLNDVTRVFHHPAIRDPHCELHRNMFSIVEQWVHARPDRGQNLQVLLSSDSVKAGKNHIKSTDTQQEESHFGGLPGMDNFMGHGHGAQGHGGQAHGPAGGHGGSSGMPHIPHMPQMPASVSSYLPGHLPKLPGFGHGGGFGLSREAPTDGSGQPDAYSGGPPQYQQGDYQAQQQHHGYQGQPGQQQPGYDYNQGPPPNQYGQGPPPDQYGYGNQGSQQYGGSSGQYYGGGQY